MINEHRENERNDNEMHESDLLYTLLKVQDLESGNEKITDSQLHDEIMTMFLAGHETTSNALNMDILFTIKTSCYRISIIRRNLP